MREYLSCAGVFIDAPITIIIDVVALLVARLKGDGITLSVTVGGTDAVACLATATSTIMADCAKVELFINAPVAVIIQIVTNFGCWWPSCGFTTDTESIIGAY